MNKKIVLYPEVLSSVLINKEEDVFTIWLLAKKIDHENKGLVELKELLNICKISLGLNSTYIYNKISKGTGLYWRKPNGKNGNKIVGLFSINKIIDRLKPKITRVKPVELNQNLFKADSLNLKHLRLFYASVVIGRFTDSRPISIQTLSDNLGFSESAVHNVIKSIENLKVFNNFQVISEHDNLLSAKLEYLKFNSNQYKIVPKFTKFYIAKQLPNSYHLLDLDRLPLRHRPRALKQNDKIMLDKIQDKRYHINGLDKTINNCKIISNISHTSE